MNELTNKEIAAADERLRRAINECVEVRGWDNNQKVLVDYIVLAARQGFNNDGDTITSYNYLVPDDSVPFHRIMGLMSIFEKLISDQLLSTEEPD